jgi:MFS family permease
MAVIRKHALRVRARKIVNSMITNTEKRTRHNARLFAIGQALYGGHTVTLLTTGGLIGKSFSPDPSYATLPISAFVIGTMLSAIPASMFMKKVGRRIGFITGAAFGSISGFLGLLAIFQQDFLFFVVAMLFTGTYQAFSMLYRFAAADLATPEFKARAVAWVTVGGLAAAFLGPLIVVGTKDLIPGAPFAGCYLTVAALAVIAALLMMMLDQPDGPKSETVTPGRPLSEILKQPRLIVAIGCGMMSFGMMNLVMTATPLAIVEHGFSISTAALVIQWHVIAMYFPSFFTGRIINKIGVEKVIAIGMLILGASGIASLSGLHIANFAVGLILLGIGWNFGFVGATVMVTDHYSPEEKNKVQGLNDFCVFSIVAIASLSSGKLLHFLGWSAVNLALFPMIIITLTLLGWLIFFNRKSKASAPAKNG